MKYRIGNGVAAILTVSALIFDLIGLIPFTEDITTAIFWGIAGFYLWKKGVKPFSGKKLATMASSFLIGLIPALQALPQLTLGIVVLIWFTRAEDKLGISAESIMSPLNAAGRRNPVIKKPLNSGGVRMPLKSGREAIQPK